MKKQIQEKVDSFSLWDLEGDLQAAIDYLIRIRDRNSNYYKLELECPFNYDNDVSVIVNGIRMETDEEESKRESEEKIRLDKAAKERRLQYEKLKKEFES